MIYYLVSLPKVTAETLFTTPPLIDQQDLVRFHTLPYTLLCSFVSWWYPSYRILPHTITILRAKHAVSLNHGEKRLYLTII